MRRWFGPILISAASLALLISCNEPPQSAAAETCAAHGMGEAECPFCHPNLVAALGPCREHGVPEALCWVCKPQLVAAFQRQGDWCAEHARPESLCEICHPGRASASSKPATIEAMPAADLPRSQRAPSVICTTAQNLVRLASADAVRSAGFEFSRVERRPISQSIACNAEILYDGNRFARVAPRVSGVVHEVVKDVGARVAAGDVLAIVDSPELATARAEYLQALELVALREQSHQATHELVQKGIAGRQEDLEAESKLAEARISLSRTVQQLRTLGLSQADIDRLASTHDTSPLLAVTAPFAGEVVERSAVVGETANALRPLFAIADPQRMWANLDLYDSDIADIAVGQPVVITIDGLRGESFGGKITWISREIDPKTRTLHVRAELENLNGFLRANMFGRAAITIHERAPLLVVPVAAVQWDGCCNIAFVRSSDVVFEPRKLRLGREFGGYYEVKDGLAEGDVVVTQGSFMLKTEIMKSSIGAGCCETGVRKS